MDRRRMKNRRDARRKQKQEDLLPGVLLVQMLCCCALLVLARGSLNAEDPELRRPAEAVAELMQEPFPEWDRLIQEAAGCWKTWAEPVLPMGGMLAAEVQKDPPAGATFAPIRVSGALYAPVEGIITCGYGYRDHPITGKPDFHTGIDVASPEGTPIRAALPGIVDRVGKSEIYGNYVELDHGGGFRTRYCHCQRVTAHPGERLRRGEQLALVGSTGISTGPHLHFEVLADGVLADPMWVLAERTRPAGH